MMSPEALEHDKSLGVPLIPVKKIYTDSNFNSRGAFGAAEVIELAKDVAKRGLFAPIIARPLWDSESALKLKGYEYFLMAGFRRHYAYRVNEADFVPCVVKNVKSEFEARDINAMENLQRLDLNLMQEANAIRHYWAADWTREDIARKINKSPGWVQLRCMALEMPPEVQAAISQGYILQSDVREIYKYKTPAERLKYAGIVRDKRKAGITKNVAQSIKKKDKATTKKIRGKEELFELMETLRAVCKRADPTKELLVSELLTPQGNSIVTRIFAWTTGDANAYEVHAAIQKFANLIGSSYEMPEFAQEEY